MTAAAVRHAAVLGSPVAHSLSPVLHTAAYASLGLDVRYHALTCAAEELPPLVARLAASGRWVGLSLTMPLKVAGVLCCDRVRTDLGAVNTLVFGGSGVDGFNTDVAGVAAALRELGGSSATWPAAAVLGAGGTARAAVAALASLGTTSVSIHVRDPLRAEPVADLARAAGLAVSVAGFGDVPARVPVVSTVPAAAGAALVADGFVVDGPLLDVVYAPWPSALAQSTLGRGQPVVGGLAVLVAQAAEQVRLMTGMSPELAPMRAAGERALAARP